MHRPQLKIYKMFGKSPRIDIKPNTVDKKIIRAGYIIITLNFALILLFYSTLPEIVPNHFDLYGNANGFGEKSSIYILPIISLLIYFGMTMVATKVKPYYFNLPTKVTEKNAPQLYAITIRMMVVMNLIIAIVFTIITMGIIRSALSGSNSISMLTLPLSLIAIFACIIYYAFKMFKIPK